MVKVTAPMLSEDARGSLGTAVNFSKHRGVNVARTIPKPINPRTATQVSARAMLAFLSTSWHNLPPFAQETWVAPSRSYGTTPFHAFLSLNLKAWNLANAPYQEYPKTGVAPVLRSPTVIITSAPKSLHLRIDDLIPGPFWGWAIHRSLTLGFAGAHDNLIACIPRLATPTFYTDAPLTPGLTYEYLVRAFALNGHWGSWSRPQSGVPL